MKCTVRWMGEDAGMSFVGESGTGHAVVMDGAVESGGRNLGPRPMEMLLLGAGGCTSFDVVLILKKFRQNINDCKVDVLAERAASDPKVFTKIHFHFVITGKDLNVKHVERAIELSHEKYCSATIMLAAKAEITHDYEIIEV